MMASAAQPAGSGLLLLALLAAGEWGMPVESLKDRALARARPLRRDCDLAAAPAAARMLNRCSLLAAPLRRAACRHALAACPCPQATSPAPQQPPARPRPQQ